MSWGLSITLAFWHLIPHPAIQLAVHPGPGTSALFVMERDARLNALVPDGPNPVQVQRSKVRAALSAGDDPGEGLTWLTNAITGSIRGIGVLLRPW